jgi:hypothetical protein
LDFLFENIPSGNPAELSRVGSDYHYEMSSRATQAITHNPGLPDFSWYNIPKRGEKYQMTTKYTKWP